MMSGLLRGRTGDGPPPYSSGQPSVASSAQSLVVVVVIVVIVVVVVVVVAAAVVALPVLLCTGSGSVSRTRRRRRSGSPPGSHGNVRSIAMGFSREPCVPVRLLCAQWFPNGNRGDWPAYIPRRRSQSLYMLLLFYTRIKNKIPYVRTARTWLTSRATVFSHFIHTYGIHY